MPGVGIIVATLCVALASGAAAQSASVARFVVRPDTALLDERVSIVLAGLRPGDTVDVTMTGGGAASRATFVADTRGLVDLATAAPIDGSYSSVDAMGLFWSARRDEQLALRPGRKPTGRTAPTTAPAPAQPVPFRLAAELRGRVVGVDTVWRRAVAPDVRVTRLRENGIVGTLYEPPGEGPHPALVVLSGSNGGTMPPAQAPGGLSSRGYVVLALAYFADDGLPSQLVNIPLEYFERALVWLRTRRNVDSSRVGLVGASRGGELALLLGSTYPRLVRAVVAYTPSSVVWPGCCEVGAARMPAWTLRGEPVAYMPPAPSRQVAIQEQSMSPTRMSPQFMRRLTLGPAVARASIPVERIEGPILLISAQDDGVWPSHEMATQIMHRLERYQFRHPYRHLSYPNAGHFLGRPFHITTHANDSVHPVTGRRTDAGGTPAATARAREESWAELLAFLDLALRARR